MKENYETWRRQVQQSIRDVSELKRYINISEGEEEEVHRAEKEFQWWVTPYYAQLMDRHDPACPIRMQAVPRAVELEDADSMMDPLDEEKHNPAPNIIKVYPDRIAWCVSNICPVLCRHCLRKRMVGRENFDFSQEARDAALSYIERTGEIRDVLITGGDPLMHSDDLLEEILSRLRAIEHVEIIRIGTRTLCTMPQRVTEKLCRMLKKLI